MKSVLISIQPKWVEKIANGKKTIEVRKTAPKCKEPFKCYIYVTKAKKWFHSGIILTSNELLWLSSGKLKMCDGFELWVDGEDYQCVNGKVIGEFVCDNAEWMSMRDCDKACMTLKEAVDYGKGKKLYGWHISDLKIYDKPKALSEFYTKKTCNSCKKSGYESTACMYDEDCKVPVQITRAPQSWCYVEE